MAIGAAIKFSRSRAHIANVMRSRDSPNQQDTRMTLTNDSKILKTKGQKMEKNKKIHKELLKDMDKRIIRPDEEQALKIQLIELFIKQNVVNSKEIISFSNALIKWVNESSS